MKHVIFIILLLFLFGEQSLKAQEPEYEMLFSRKTSKNNRNLRVYGTLMAFHSPIKVDGERIGSPNLAVEIGLSYKRKFGFGFTSQSVGNYVGLFKSKPIEIQGGNVIGESTVLIQQIGAVATYTHNPGKKLHSFTRLFISDYIYSTYKANNESYIGLCINPNFGVEYNLLPYLTLRSELGYKFFNLNKSHLAVRDFDLNGLIGCVSLKIANIR